MGDSAATLLVLGLLSFVSSGRGAKRCYICNSIDNSLCDDPFNKTAASSGTPPLQPVECVETPAVEQLLDILGLRNKSVLISCQKAVYKVPEGHVVVRSCKIDTDGKATCDINSRPEPIVFCGLCDEDGCNVGAPSRSLWGALPLAAALAAAGALG